MAIDPFCPDNGGDSGNGYWVSTVRRCNSQAHSVCAPEAGFHHAGLPLCSSLSDLLFLFAVVML